MHPLLILTHIDENHVQGAVPLLKKLGVSVFKYYWLNHGPVPLTYKDGENTISIKQGITVRDVLLPTNRLNSKPILSLDKFSIGDALLTVVSPDADQYEKLIVKWKQEEEKQAIKRKKTTTSASHFDHDKSVADLAVLPFTSDDSYSNRSSIAFILEIGPYKALFLADSQPDVVCKSLTSLGYSKANPIRVDIVKVSHHGSKANTSDELLEFIDCNKFLISVNGSNRHNLPNKESLSRIIVSVQEKHTSQPILFYFTHDDNQLRRIFTIEEMQKYSIECFYPEPTANSITITFS